MTAPCIIRRLRTAQGRRAYRVTTLEGIELARFAGRGALRRAFRYQPPTD